MTRAEQILGLFFLVAAWAMVPVVLGWEGVAAAACGIAFVAYTSRNQRR